MPWLVAASLLKLTFRAVGAAFRKSKATSVVTRGASPDTAMLTPRSMSRAIPSLTKCLSTVITPPTTLTSL